MSRTISIYKTVEVDIREEIKLSKGEIQNAILDAHDLDDILEELGFLPKEALGIADGTILESMKLEIIKDLLKNATLEQLEQFRKTL